MMWNVKKRQKNTQLLAFDLSAEDSSFYSKPFYLFFWCSIDNLSPRKKSELKIVYVINLMCIHTEY